MMKSEMQVMIYYIVVLQCTSYQKLTWQLKQAFRSTFLCQGGNPYFHHMLVSVLTVGPMQHHKLLQFGYLIHLVPFGGALSIQWLDMFEIMYMIPILTGFC